MLDKLLLYAIVSGLLLVGGWYQLDAWHYEPMKQKDALIKKYGEEYNKAYNKLYKCEQGSKVESIENYAEGLEDANSNSTSSTLDDIGR